MISAQTGSQILKTVSTGSGNRKLQFELIFFGFLVCTITKVFRHCPITCHFRKIRNQLELWGVNFSNIYWKSKLNGHIESNGKLKLSKSRQSWGIKSFRLKTWPTFGSTFDSTKRLVHFETEKVWPVPIIKLYQKWQQLWFHQRFRTFLTKITQDDFLASSMRTS